MDSFDEDIIWSNKHKTDEEKTGNHVDNNWNMYFVVAITVIIIILVIVLYLVFKSDKTKDDMMHHELKNRYIPPRSHVVEFNTNPEYVIDKDAKMRELKEIQNATEEKIKYDDKDGELEEEDIDETLKNISKSNLEDV